MDGLSVEIGEDLNSFGLTTVVEEPNGRSVHSYLEDPGDGVGARIEEPVVVGT